MGIMLLGCFSSNAICGVGVAKAEGRGGRVVGSLLPEVRVLLDEGVREDVTRVEVDIFSVFEVDVGLRRVGAVAIEALA